MPEWHSTTHRLRFCDNDSVGHVNNSVYSVMLEAGRTELLDASQAIGRGGPLSPVVVRLEIDFRREMSWPGDVTIQSAVAAFSNKTVRIRHRVLYKDYLAAEGVSVLAVIDRETRRAVPLTDAIRNAFGPWTIPDA